MLFVVVGSSWLKMLGDGGPGQVSVSRQTLPNGRYGVEMDLPGGKVVGWWMPAQVWGLDDQGPGRLMLMECVASQAKIILWFSSLRYSLSSFLPLGAEIPPRLG